MFIHLISYIARMYDKEAESGTTKAHVKAQIFENKILEMGDMSRMSKEDIIQVLGEPRKIKALKDGTQCLVWKGRRHKVKIFVDALDRYSHRDESYT